MENKSLGGALVEVFDAAFGLAKSEISAVGRRVGDIAKAKGLGVVLLLASLVPLTLAMIFLILFVFYGLIRLGLGAWAAALLIGLLSLVVTGALIFIGLKKLGGDVPDEDDTSNLSDIAKDDLKYGYTSAGAVSKPAATEQSTSADKTTTTTTSSMQSKPAAQSSTTEHGHTTGGHQIESAPVKPVTANSTSTQGKPTNEHDGGKSETTGIGVSTNPTYRDDMKKEGY